MRVHWRSLVHVTDYIFSLCLLLFGGCHCQSDGGGGGAGHATQYPIHYYTRLKKKNQLRCSKRSTKYAFFLLLILPLLDRKTHQSYFHLNNTLVFFRVEVGVCGLPAYVQHTAIQTDGVLRSDAY